MSYAVRTCNKCGIRKPQPEMVQKELYVEVAKSQPGISLSTIIGREFNDKKSTKAYDKWFHNTSQRTYKRKKKVWLCKSCSGAAGGSVAGGIFAIAIIVFIVWLVL